MTMTKDTGGYAFPAWGNLSYENQMKIRNSVNCSGLSEQQLWTHACSIYELIRAMIAERNKP